MGGLETDVEGDLLDCFSGAGNHNSTEVLTIKGKGLVWLVIFEMIFGFIIPHFGDGGTFFQCRAFSAQDISVNDIEDETLLYIP